MNKALLAVVGAAMVVGTASAQIKTYNGQGGNIPDVSSTRFSIFVPDHGPATVQSIAIDMSHTWVGDLFIEVRHKTPADYSVVLCDRPGSSDGISVGNGADLNGVYTFRDGFAPFSETGAVPAGTYGPHAGQTISRSVADKFGEWSLFISDNAAQDVGVVRGWSMTFQNIPTPGSLALLGLGGLVVGRRRR